MYCQPGGWLRNRKLLLRANPVSREALAWSIVAGLFAIIALAGFWIITFRLFPMQANRLLPAQFTSSRILIAAIMIGASILAPISEESGIRGYLQASLERNFKPATAVAMSSIVFAVAHVAQGMAWPKLVCYFLVGVTFGTLAYLNDSILPVIPVHIAGDLIFFLFVWPHDKTRSLVWRTGADLWFWIHIVQMIVFTGLAVLAFRRLNQARLSTGAFDQCIVQPHAL
jgi:membrane protease YdiL (CAAX protease family)